MGNDGKNKQKRKLGFLERVILSFFLLLAMAVIYALLNRKPSISLEDLDDLGV